MKKFFILALLLVSTAAVTFASSLVTVQEDLIYKSFLSTIVPEDYVEPFYENTKSNVTIGIELLAIGQKETEWKMKDDGTWPVCRNSNGSTDHGPLQLNSSNFKSFERMFGEGLEEYKGNIDIYRMCLCIRYYQDIRCRSGTYNAFREYNGGYRYHNKPVTKDYADLTSKYNNRFARNYYSYKRDETARIQKEETERLLARLKAQRGIVALKRDVKEKHIGSVPLKKIDKIFYIKKEDLFYWFDLV